MSDPVVSQYITLTEKKKTEEGRRADSSPGHRLFTKPYSYDVRAKES